MRGKPYNHIADMVIHMKTTFNIDDALMQQLRVEAARRGVTMTQIVESGIRHMIATSLKSTGNAQELPKLPSKAMGRAMIDIADREELYRIFDYDKPPW